MEHKSLLSRRGVLKSIGLAGAAIVSSPVIDLGSRAEAAMTTAAGKKSGKVGLLLPSGRAQNYSSSFMTGFYQRVHELGKKFPFAFTAEKFGENESAYQKFKLLLEQEHPEIIIGLLNSRQSNQLHGLIEQSGVTFIEANLGENFFHKALASDKVYHVSMNLWQAHYVLGTWAAKNSGKEAICVSSFFDSGYDAHYAFTAGFESAGGTVLETIISGKPSEDLSPVEAAALASGSKAKIIFANYSGTEAGIFLSALKNTISGQSKKIFGSSMMIQPRLAKFIGEDIKGVISATTWMLDGSQESAEFGARYRTVYKSEPDDFAALGYDSAGLLTSGFSLEPAPFTSARGGKISVNSSSHETESPVYIIEMARADDGHILGKSSLTDQISSASYRLVEQMRSGGIDVYPAM